MGLSGFNGIDDDGIDDDGMGWPFGGGPIPLMVERDREWSRRVRAALVAAGLEPPKYTSDILNPSIWRTGLDPAVYEKYAAIARATPWPRVDEVSA